MPAIYLTLSSYGGVPDMRQTNTGASITNGSTTLTIGDAGFASADIGKTVVVGTGGGFPHIATISAIISGTQVTMSVAAPVTVASTGASWGTDCSGALQAAIDAVAAEDGGTIAVDGRYLLTGGVIKNLASSAAHIEIVGFGSNSAFAVSTPTYCQAIVIQNASRVIFRRVHFLGTPNQSDDVGFLFIFQQSNVSFYDCGFWGIAAVQANSAIIRNVDCDFEMTGCHFGGCVTSYGQGTSVVQCFDWRSVHLSRCRWIDYGHFGSIRYSKTGFAGPLGWVHIGATGGPDLNAIGQGVARIIDCRGDEGAIHGVYISPGSGNHLGRVIIDGWESNVGAVPSSSGIYVENAINVEILRCSFGFVTALEHAMRIRNCTNVFIDQCEASDGATRITVENVGQLTIRNSPTITTRNLIGIGQYSQGVKSYHLPNIAGGGIPAGGWYTYAITGINCAIANIIVGLIGNGEGDSADKYKIGYNILNRTSTGCSIRINNFGAHAQTIDVDIQIT